MYNTEQVHTWSHSNGITMDNMYSNISLSVQVCRGQKASLLGHRAASVALQFC